MAFKIILTDLSNSMYNHLDKASIISYVNNINTHIQECLSRNEFFYGDLHVMGLHYYEPGTRAFGITKVWVEDDKICGNMFWVPTKLGEMAEREIKLMKNKFLMSYTTEGFSEKVKSIHGWSITIEDIKERKIWEEDNTPFSFLEGMKIF